MRDRRRQFAAGTLPPISEYLTERGLVDRLDDDLMQIRGTSVSVQFDTEFPQPRFERNLRLPLHIRAGRGVNRTPNRGTWSHRRRLPALR